MSGPRMVGPHQREELRAALAASQVIAVPGDGGYHLAVSCTDLVALVRLSALRKGVDDLDAPRQVVVGSREQAAALAPLWSDEARHLTDRMWPGPLAVIVPGDEGPVLVTMPAARPVRLLCRDAGPLAVTALRRSDGQPVVTADDVQARCTDQQVTLILNGGTCRGPGPTVVDCTVSPPAVRRVGALPESFVDATFMMGRRRRGWFGRRRGTGAGSG
jgi:tRNA A37 threonylcarbamoyladenosine synthetase subunit TsaC/SUA5/YrdC